MSRPEATPEEVGRIHNGMSVCLDSNDIMSQESIVQAVMTQTRSASEWQGS